VLLGCVVLGYAGLIGLGQWQADEYDDFARLAQNGWSALWLRLSWSPRPLSETLFYSYGWIANHLERPLIVPFLGALWLGFVAAGLFTALQAWQERRDGPAWPGVLVATSLMASFVAGGGLTEVFYWPAGAVAYLPTLSATLLLFLQVATGRLRTRSGRLLVCGCLLVAAGSSEMGAAFVFAFAVVQALHLGWIAARRTADSARRWPVWWWIIPAGLSVAVMVAVAANRLHVLESPTVLTSDTVGHPVMSLWRASGKLLEEVAGWRTRSDGPAGLSGSLPAELLLAAGIGICWWRVNRPDPETRRQIGATVVALILGALFTLAAAYLHFGAPAGERHETMRRCWIFLSFAGVGILGFSHSGMERLRRLANANVLAPLLLCGAIATLWHARALVREYKAFAPVSRAIEQNYESGFNAGDEMTYEVPPNRGVLTFAEIKPGTYTLRSADAEYPVYVLRYFKKQMMVVREPQK
jgi:hypothetical protein